ncbi:dihydrofolate reductase [Sphingobacterium sp. DK4209]|uniref:Dihydrofolate reductase n=1 Tax=Sphingobacterium zhuxiongii TaxID=2662364 RepID=A0A5Q0QAM2_9SPHI|nr:MULTISPECIES: dihydrofolate reductase [unclassified Sphingobacterium]MVZ67267.1 dihydrofolate reductase [Sphingobacterium sp. DK4209]QGA27177.1 dihydrofolate reductase [Sphingobacterium sp. dk4302]
MSYPTLTLIVAASENNAIGKNNQMLWHLPNDFKYFKSQTMDHSIVMGRKTFESIGKPLPGRRNIVITRQATFEAEDVDVANSLQDVFSYCRDEQEVFIIGGAQIYQQALPLASKVLLTRVHATIEDADAYFPVLPSDDWELISSEPHSKDEKHQYDYTFEVYNRIKK